MPARKVEGKRGRPARGVASGRKKIIAPQRILCVCLRGNSRSAAMAWVLKEEYHRDAVAIGWSAAGSELMNMLAEWSQTIVVMQEGMRQQIPGKYRDKVIACDVGDDRWVDPRHPELQGLCRAFAAKHLV